MLAAFRASAVHLESRLVADAAVTTGINVALVRRPEVVVFGCY